MKKEKRMVTVISSKTGKPLVSDKQQRNTLCDCGSGKKCKKCCGATHRYYDSGAKKVNDDAIPNHIERPNMGDYGYHVQESFDDLPTGWQIEGGEDAYYEALAKWEASKTAK